LDWTGETPVVTNWPNASPITYGQAVSNATLTGGTTSVPGGFSYDLPGFVPHAGDYAAAVTFTPDDITNYNTVAGVVTVAVFRATPTVVTWPTASSIEEGQRLSDSTLVGGTASEPGIFTFDSPATTPPVGTYTAAVTFVVSDSTNYRNVSGGEVDVTVDMRTAYSMQISFTNLPGGATLTNFPALVKLNTTNTENYVGFIGSANGYDLRFWTNATFTGTELNYEIESFDSNGNSFIWVQVPELRQGSSIWATWGDDNYTNQQAYTTNGAVWSEGFEGVWHLAEDASGTGTTGLYRDSSPYARHGKDLVSSTGKEGVVGAGQLFDRSSTDYIDVLGYRGIAGSADRTVSLWFKGSNTTDSQGMVGWGSAGSNGSKWHVRPNNNAGNGTLGGVRTEVQGGYETGNSSIANDGWNHVVSVFSGSVMSNVVHYVNGEDEDMSSAVSSQAVNTLTNAVGSVDVTLGARYGTVYETLDGSLDEVRISSVRRSFDWIWAEYMSQGTNHSSFVEYGRVSPSSGISWSGIGTSNITTTSAWATATVNMNLDTCVLVWDETVDAPADGVSTNDWQYRLSLGSQSAGVVTTQMTGLVQGTSYTWRVFASNAYGVAWSEAATFTTLEWTKETPVVSNWPSASPITYGQAVSNSVLSGGSASPSGSFGFATPAATPPLGTNTVDVIFSPADFANYLSVTGSVQLVVMPPPVRATVILFL
jgi:hypothetical protein